MNFSIDGGSGFGLVKVELNNTEESIYNDELEQKSYNLGRLDALVGDDVKSSDNQTNEEILKRIKTWR